MKTKTAISQASLLGTPFRSFSLCGETEIKTNKEIKIGGKQMSTQLAQFSKNHNEEK